MVAMAITVIIVTVLVSITSIAIDTWNRSRAELRASRQAKAMVETMARDFEALVTRSGGKDPVSGRSFEWLVADSTKSGSATTSPLPSTNATELIFFTAVTDRYNGNVGDPADDKGGDVSCVGYQLLWKDPIDQNGNVFNTFVLNRLLRSPDDAFANLLGKSDLAAAFTQNGDITNAENFVCENLYQFTISFHLSVPSTTVGAPPVQKVVSIGPASTVKKISIRGDGIETAEDPTLKAAKLTAVEISLTVLSDLGVDQMRRRSNFTSTQQSEFLAKNSYQYSKRVQVPGM